MSGGRGAGDLPLTWHGAYDATVTYLPRQVISSGGSVYMALAKQLGVAPPAASWLPMGSVGGWTPEVIYAGYARVATNVLPPGLRAPVAGTLTAVYLRANIAATGASLVWVVKVNGSPATTLTLTSGATSTSSTGLSVALAAGDVVTFDITGIGSTVAGGDLACQLIAA